MSRAGLRNKESLDKDNMKLWFYLKKSIMRNPGQCIQERETKITYQELLESAETLGRKLTHKKYGILCDSMINSAIAILACLSKQITAVPMSRQYGKCFEEEIIEQIELSAVLTDENGKIDEKEIGTVKEKQEKSFAFILCTSGSTGKPKGVCLSQEAVLSTLKYLVTFFPLNKQDSLLASRGLFHCSPIIGELLTCLCIGVQIYLYQGEFLADYILGILSKYRITAYLGTPTMLYYLSLSQEKKQLDLSLRFSILGGECLNTDVKNNLLKAFPKVQFINSYGMTETCSKAALYILDERKASNCVGKPLPFLDMMVVDKDGIPVKKGETGELYIKGISLFSGYYHDDKRTNEVLRDGWFCSGDLAWQDNDGALYIVSRIDNMIIRGGVNIYPEKIEETILSDKNIKQVVVFGERENAITEKIVAWFTLWQKEDVMQVKMRLQELCKEELGIHWVPDEMKIVEKIPSGRSGKAVRRSKNE